MPSKSKKQQKLFGMVRKCQKTGECASDTVKKMAKDIEPKAVHDFAATKHKGLPKKVKKKKTKTEGYKSFSEFMVVKEAKHHSCKEYCPKCKKNCHLCKCDK